MTSETIDLISSELDYKTKRFSHSQPLYARVNPQSGGTSISPQVASPIGPVSFTIPASCIVLSKSYIQFNLALTAVPLTYANLQGNVASMINRITLSTIGSNTILADLPFTSNYADAINVYATSYEDYKNKPAPLLSLVETTAVAAALTPIEDIAPSYSSSANSTPISWVTGAAVGTASSNSFPYNQFQENPRYAYTSANANANEFITIRLPLSVFKLTALSLDKVMYFGGLQLQLDIYFEAATRWCFTNTSNQYRFDQGPAQITQAALASNCISNIGLFVYMEQDKDICSKLISQVMSQGLKLKVPFVTTYKTNQAAGASTVSYNITAATGEKLLLVAWTGYNNTESGPTAKDHQIFPLSLTSYQTTLNSIPIVTNNLINVATGDHFIYNRDSIKNSAITNLFAYNQQFVHFDNFTGMTIPELQANLTTEAGIPCSAQTQTWSLSVTNAATQLNYYVFFVTQKTLTVSNGDVSVSIQS